MLIHFKFIHRNYGMSLKQFQMKLSAAAHSEHFLQNVDGLW